MLYRKYRSQKFAELVGQDAIVQILKQSIVEDKVAHAYLFSGPRGTGKTSTARIMAKALNCLKIVEGEPCNDCINCRSITLGKFLDLIEIDAASNRGIEEIRSLKEKIGFVPVQGKYKVYIIDEVHMLTTEAFNALLKTLEEPPSNVIFILATTEVYKIPATILSRTQRFDFKLASEADLVRKLEIILAGEGFKAEKNVLELLARSGLGSFRDAETLLDKVLSSLSSGKTLDMKEVSLMLGYAENELITNFVTALLEQNRVESLQIFNNIVEKGINITHFLKQTLEFLRLEVVETMRVDSAKLKQLMQIIKSLNGVAQELKYALLPRLLVEVAIIELTQGKIQQTNAKVIEQISNKKINNVVASEKDDPNPRNKAKSTIQLNEEKFSEIKVKWPQIVAESKQYNHQLVAVLSTATIELNSDNNLVILVPYSFHKDRLEEAETRKILTGLIEKKLGFKVGYICLVDKNKKGSRNKEGVKGNTDLVENLLN